MQTRHRFLSVCARTVAVALTTLAFVGVTACSAPRIAGRSEQEQELGTCERFLETAQSYSNTMGDANIPLYLRYFTASLAQHDWLNVALQCPSQFGDATMRSAQAQHFTRLAANHFGFAYAPLTVTKLDTVDSLDLPGEALATIALAEDRAGFAAEVLAGRYDSYTPTSANTSSDAEFVRRLASNATLLTMSDNHKEAAARLTMLSKGAQDIRRKVYDTRMLTTSEVNATDPATGLRTRTPAKWIARASNCSASTTCPHPTSPPHSRNRRTRYCSCPCSSPRMPSPRSVWGTQALTMRCSPPEQGLCSDMRKTTYRI